MIDKRANGVLLHISSLPGTTGIGTLGKSAYDFVDYLESANQSYWQILPICPTSYGDSPYQSFSTFAGNPYFIDLDVLADEGLLSKSDYDKTDWGSDETSVDYGKLYVERHKLFKILQENFFSKIPSGYDAFCSENEFWLEDYALFMALKDAHGGVSFDNWEEDLRCRKESVLAEWRVKAADRISYYKMLQFLFYRQWFALKEYANKKGIEIIGDIPIYVAADSADVWASPAQFCLDDNFKPVEVAGCPPDAFSADGQLWGNPVYNWDYMKSTDYAWWKKRLEKSLSIYDIVRIDHFRGFDSYYCIPYGMKNARIGQWRTGPGMDLFTSLKNAFGDMNVIAEDLGYLTDSVKKLLKDSGFPGMKILQFAFDSREASDYIPYKYGFNCVVYTGTHDNDTILGWCSSASKDDVAFAKKFLRAESDSELVSEMMVSAMGSAANTCVLCMQDLMGLDGSARMNMPSTVGTNWKWRAKKEQFTKESAEFLRYYTELYGRGKPAKN